MTTHDNSAEPVKSLQDFKDGFAQRYDYKDWYSLYWDEHNESIDHFIDSVISEYAKYKSDLAVKEQAKPDASLEQSAKEYADAYGYSILNGRVEKFFTAVALSERERIVEQLEYRVSQIDAGPYSEPLWLVKGELERLIKSITGKGDGEG